MHIKMYALALTILVSVAPVSIQASITQPTSQTTNTNWHTSRYYGPHIPSNHTHQNPYQTMNYGTTQGPIRLTGRLKK